MSCALTKADLVQSLFLEVGLNKREAKGLVDQFFEEIVQALESGEEVKFSGLGKFLLRDKKKRMGRNPRTKKVYPISSRRVVTFNACRKFRQAVNEGCDALKEK